MNEKWFVKDGHIFSTEEKVKESKEFRKGKQFKYNEAVAFNVGRLAHHIVRLHNEYIDSKNNK